jgi:hypothetical protein
MPQVPPIDGGALRQGELCTNPFGQLPVDVMGRVDLTIHRRTDTHHGATLRLLGHAAEHLIESGRFDFRAAKANDQAVHILMRLSREVFEEYAEGVAVRRRFHDWLMNRVVEHCD